MAPKQDDPLTFTEVDEVGHPTATYIYSKSNNGRSTTGRIDVLHPPYSTSLSWSIAALRNLLVEVFLPAGYPHSVSEDYVPYQLFDSLQAFCSSIAGLLSSRAVLQGVGVGNASASPTSALLLHILQDTSGRIATILFAHRVGTALEPECKMYRLAADVFNDFAMILDCLSPMIPSGSCRVGVLSTAGVLRALCGVSGGSSKASLSAHFAKWGNLAEVNAKDSSQETVISLIGMLVGSLVVSHITSYTATWISLITLLTVHLGMNYAAVRAVQMTSLNRQRANIVFSTLLNSDFGQPHSAAPDTTADTTPANHPPHWHICTPAQAAKQERIFSRGSILKWTTAQTVSTVGTCQIGLSLHQFITSHSEHSYSVATKSTGTTSLKTPLPLPQLTKLFTHEPYLLFLSRSTKSKSTWHATILLQPTSTTKDQLKAWMHALLCARLLSTSPYPFPSTSTSTSTSKPSHPNPTTTTNNNTKETAPDPETATTLNTLLHTLHFLNTASRFENYLSALAAAGWDLDVAALETQSGRRVSFPRSLPSTPTS
ncbi:RUS1 family protein [Aspergillus candidus]|uniref:Vitamin B6 photo-protection and homoeostasis-domain-containing protein n=1 Tax=Aspergillus candidus TaxID=41067 RepID=A0A2I2F6U0_ASPCN|nr:vitamin B6 photo-protection and homoeostasis-domain-containing protein [Aspergillus candidus]PLB36353.1 vitamin B6 photo-protection and homoeostasis-domain-containing protein [Aspergillus candidus]